MNREKKVFWSIVVFALFMLALVDGIDNISHMLTYKSGLEDIVNSYINSVNKIFTYIISILFIAISFKTVSRWKMSFVSYVANKYAKLKVILLICMSVSLAINVLSINLLVDASIILIFLTAIELYVFLFTIIIILKELLYAGDNKRMDALVQELFLTNTNIILSTIDYHHPINDSQYYSFLEKIKKKELEELLKEVSSQSVEVSNFEFKILSEAVNRNNNGEYDISISLEKAPQYIKYLNELDTINTEILLECANIILPDQSYKNVLSQFKKLIEIDDYIISDLFNPQIQNIYTKNDTLIDELIIYSMEEPNQSKENFLFNLLESSLLNSATYIEKGVIKTSTDFSRNQLLMKEGVMAIYHDGIRIEDLSYNNFNNFIKNVCKFNDLQLLDYLQTEYNCNKRGEESLIGIYGLEYFMIINKFITYGRNMNLYLKNMPLDSSLIHLENETFFNTITFENINFLNVEGEVKKNLLNVSFELKTFIDEIVPKNRLISLEQAQSVIQEQIVNTNNIAIEVFLKLNSYIFENQNNCSQDLSEAYYKGVRGLVTDINLRYYQGLNRYMLNINFVLYDIFIRKYNEFTRLNININNTDEILLESNNFKITYAQAFDITYGICLIQYYIDSGKIPEVTHLFSQNNTAITIIEKCCNLIIDLYKDCDSNDIHHTIPGYYDYKTIKIADNGLRKNRKIQTKLTSNIAFKFEERTVFHVLLKLLLNIESRFMFNSKTKYTEKIEKLLVEINILNK